MIYEIMFTPDNTYAQYSFYLGIALAIIIVILSTCLCSLIIKYKKTKKKNINSLIDRE